MVLAVEISKEIEKREDLDQEVLNVLVGFREVLEGLISELKNSKTVEKDLSDLGMSFDEELKKVEKEASNSITRILNIAEQDQNFEIPEELAEF